MADRKKMSVAEILAAARAEKAAMGGQASSAAEGSPAKAEPPPPAESAVAPAADLGNADPTVASPPADRPAAIPKPGSSDRPSVKDILAMARKKAEAPERQSGSPVKQPSRADSPAEPVAKAATPAKAAASKPPAASRPVAPLPRDTGSILAAARAGAKPGPKSKGEGGIGATPRTGGGVASKPDAAAAKPGHSAGPGAASRAAPLTVPPMPSRPTPKASPAKKDPAKKDNKVAVEEDRRGFLQLVLGSFLSVGFTALSISGGLFGLGLARFFFPNVLAEPPSRFKVGFKEGFPAGKVETKFVAQYGVWVVNSEFQGQQQIYALKTVCTHLGCTPNWLEAEQKFKCPCHGSGFYKDGINFEGPAPRPLERYAIRIADDGQLEVDKSRAFQEELGQWGDPASFVTA
jgi:cytochrome b6-f complex iron-sulfur subunit